MLVGQEVCNVLVTLRAPIHHFTPVVFIVNCFCEAYDVLQTAQLAKIVVADGSRS